MDTFKKIMKVAAKIILHSEVITELFFEINEIR